MNTMMRTSRRALVLMAVAALSSTLLLAGSGRTLNVELPFDFVINGSTYPAGSYHVHVDQLAPGTVAMHSADHSKRALVLATRCCDKTRQDAARVTFNGYNGTRYLSRVYLGDDGKVAVLIKTPGELALARSLAQEAPVSVAAMR